FTDVEGSTGLWQDAPDVMAQALHLHDAIIEKAAVSNNGAHIGARGEGDSHFVVFSGASDAVASARDIQRQLAAISWDTPRPIKVRASIHTGVVDFQLGQYYGTPVNRAARLRGIAHGGQTLISQGTRELVKDNLPGGVKVVDRGQHRLRDLTIPEHVFELVIDGLERDFPPLLSLDVTRNNFPIQLTDFIGRPEVEEIKRLIGEARLVTVLAPGGVGKTRSAIQASAELVSEFRDGVFFIDLAPIDSHRDIAQTAAESLGIALTSNDDLETQLLAHLVHEQQLLIFDNFEHVIEGATLLSRILIAAPEVRILVTSRVKLGISGETVINLPGLIIEWNTPDEAFEASGVRLFIDAAKRADALFLLEVDDLEPLSRILRLVGGTPLGIILSASWVDTLPVSEIAVEIEKNMDFLEAGQADQPDRHRSMRAVFEYSWRLLDEGERRTFAGLSVFKGGFTRGAAEAVAGASLRHLSNLVSKSLIDFDRIANRYAVHELLRQYAEAELAVESERFEATVAEHARYFAGLAQVAADKLLVSGDQLTAVRMVDVDVDNMRAALRNACSYGDAASARAFTLALSWVYEIHGWIKAGAEFCAGVREAFEGREDPTAIVARAVATTNEAKFLTNLGLVGSAAPLAETATEALQKTDDTLAYLMALEALCEIESYRGDADRLIELGKEAMRVGDESGYGAFSAGMSNYLAGAYLQKGDLETAVETLRAGERVLVAEHDQTMLGWNLYLQASLALAQERLDNAASMHSRQIEVARRLGYIRVLALGLTGLGKVQIQRGEWDRADGILREGLEIFERMGLVNEMGYVTILLAQVMSMSGAAERAAEAATSVRADPSSDRPFIFETTTIAESATALLDDLSTRMESEAFGAAVARGEMKGLDIVVKELLTEDRANHSSHLEN
ncbi:MAG: AAA family ATPase, partial [Acidimicrobiia bacterium]